MPEKIFLYDTTLRDGTQGEQISLSAIDKMRIARKLDDFGIHYIEGGWPGSNPKDVAFFKAAKKEAFKHARITAFGSTCKADTECDDCANIQALLQAETPAVAIVGKSWDLHATQILSVSLEENISMIQRTLRYLKAKGLEVIYDAEHLFDGFRHAPDYALKTLKAAAEAGADMIVLCDTNGGSMPDDIHTVTEKIKSHIKTPLGIHCHNDCGLALANSLAAVKAGAVMVQGTVNGYGERCGNVDLTSVMGNLQFKLNRPCIDPDKIKQLTELSRFVSEVANVPPLLQRPFVGKSAFAHKGGIHVHAIMKNPVAYEHMQPDAVGNHRRVLVSDLSGKSNIEFKSKEMGIDLGENGVDSQQIVNEIKRLEDQGYQFEAAEGSLELLIKKATGQFEEPFTLESLRVTNEKNQSGAFTSQATIKISVGKEHEITAAEGKGPISALDNALRKALCKFFPQIEEMSLVDFRVRVIDGSAGTAAKVRVQIDSRDSREIWSTIGVSENIIEASWQALSDSVMYKLAK